MSVDATVPTDQVLVSEIPGYIRDLAAQVNLNEAAIGGDYSRTVSSLNVSATLAIADLNQIYIVNAVAAVEITLPEVTGDHVGSWIRIHKLGTGDLTITPGGTDALANGGAGASISNTSAESKMAFVEFECVGAGLWLIAGILGTWS